MNCRKTSARRWWGVGLLLAAALALRADVIVLKNGTLLLGRAVGTTADSVSIQVGAAGTATVRMSDIQRLIACPPEENPDSYLKAAQRAGRAGWSAEAFACYEKSAAVEPATAAVAQSERVALQQRVLAEARTRAKAGGQAPGDIDQRRTEAQKLIAEGEAMLQAAQLAANYDARNRGPTARLLQAQGKANIEIAQAKIDEGKAMLEKVEKMLAPTPPPPPPPPPSTSEQITQWGWLIGVIVVVLTILRFVLAPFFSRR